MRDIKKIRNKLESNIHMLFGDQKDYHFDCAIRCANFLRLVLDGRNSVQEIAAFLETNTKQIYIK